MISNTRHHHLGARVIGANLNYDTLSILDDILVVRLIAGAVPLKKRPERYPK